MQDQLPKTLGALWADIRVYLKLRLELLKLLAIEKASTIMADLVTHIFVGFSLLMAFLISAITLAFYLSELLHSYTKGFGCATLFFVLVPLILLWKKAAVEKFIAGMAIKRYFQKHCGHDLKADEHEDFPKTCSTLN